MSAQDEFYKLPDWLQKLWQLAPNIARKTEDELAALRARIAELESVIALNKYVTPPYDVTDDATAMLAVKCAELEAQAAHWKAQYDQLASAVAELYEWEPLEEAQPISACPSCTWRGSVELTSGVCPQCGIDWNAQPATLTPRQCNRLCFERGFEAGREAAFNAVDNYEIDVESPLFDAFVSRDLEIMTIIESLTAPSSCGCNPLKPSESDAAMLDEWHKRM